MINHENNDKHYSIGDHPRPLSSTLYVITFFKHVQLGQIRWSLKHQLLHQKTVVNPQSLEVSNIILISNILLMYTYIYIYTTTVYTNHIVEVIQLFLIVTTNIFYWALVFAAADGTRAMSSNFQQLCVSHWKLWTAEGMAVTWFELGALQGGALDS
jgi:hypothetical protein